MAYLWSTVQAKKFWQNRKTYLVSHHPNLAEKIATNDNETHARTEKEKNEENVYISERTFLPTPQTSAGVNTIAKISSDLEFWAIYNAWTYCSECNSVTPKIMPYNFTKRPKNKKSRKCACLDSRYIVPRIKEIPPSLLSLTPDDINILRPFYLYLEETQQQSHGYQVKCCPIKLRTSQQSIEEKINDITDTTQKLRCQNAYDYLMASDTSAYSHFVQLRDKVLDENTSLNLFNFKQTEGIECALWPNLYPFTTWCDSKFSDGGSRLSSKVSFNFKLFSEILDYSLDFHLLQFQYDRWLYKTVSGAINTARVLKCSPARSLDTKSFSATYWQWQHRYLLDAVDQFGLPDIFITLSPYEWSFPFPQWLHDIRAKTGKGPTKLAAFETAHIVQVLAQVARGYFCGSNSKKWSNHIFNYNRKVTCSNVKTYFYRFEFQKRGTAHLHLLIWLKDIKQTEHQFIRADIPNDHPHLSYLVHKHQRSDKRSNCLNLREEETSFENKDGKSIVHLKHPADAFAVNLRAYISTVLPALQCSMDFQTTNGKAMLLSYVTSYVTKWQDGLGPDALYSYHVSGGQAAVRYVMDMKPAEPEMWLALSSTKISWSCSKTKRYIVPMPDHASTNKINEKYRNRPDTMESYSFLVWLRMVDHNKAVPKVYKQGNTLVGIKVVSFFNKDYFFQYMFMNFPHRRLSDLQHPDHERIPADLQWYAAAVFHFPDLWKNNEKITNLLHNQCNRDNFITTCLARVAMLADMFFLWRMQIISPGCFNVSCPTATSQFSLDNDQQTIQRHVLAAVFKRGQHYSTMNELHSFDSDSESAEEIQDDCFSHNADTHELGTWADINIVWSKPVLVTGKAGCGKSYVIYSIVNQLIRNNTKILIAAPTGFLASVFRSNVPHDVDCETVHASFHFPVEEDKAPTINWQLSNYDLIIIDEISMIPDVIFKHICKTLCVLLFRPVVMLCGDGGQQQPFCRDNGKIMQLTSPLDDTSFLSTTCRYQLKQQHRTGDAQYLSFLNTIRQWVPTQALLDTIQENRVISNGPTVTDEDILHAYQLNSAGTVLTFTSRAANRINKLIVETIFQNKQPLCTAQLDCELPPMPIYAGMRVVITQNRDKLNGVVNGQPATVHMVEKCTILLKLPNGKIVGIYQVTTKRGSSTNTVYPFQPAYATTMCKAQGQTLKKVVLWFDIDAIPPGTAYVALSRVKTQNDILFLNKMVPTFFTPVSRPSQLL